MVERIPGSVERLPTPYPPCPRPALPAHIVRTDAEAIDIATRLASIFAAGASERDGER
jgi:hypothetical protein